MRNGAFNVIKEVTKGQKFENVKVKIILKVRLKVQTQTYFDLSSEPRYES